MNFKRLSLVCLLLSLLASVGWAKKYTSLKVPNYKILNALVEVVTENKTGLTTEKVENALKLRLLGNGIKTNTETESLSHYLYVNVNVLPNGAAYNVTVEFRRYVFGYPKEISDQTGIRFSPQQGTYNVLGLTGGSASFIIEALNGALDKFLLDYLESNIE